MPIQGDYRKSILRFVSEQNATTIGQLARYAGVYRDDMERYVVRLMDEGLVAAKRLITGDDVWVWARHRGHVVAGTGSSNLGIYYRRLSHWRAVTEARLEVEELVEGARWISERALWRRNKDKRSGYVPDGVVVVGKSRFAVEVELAEKENWRVRERLVKYEGQYNGILYFAAPRVYARFERAKFQQDFPKLRVKLIAKGSRPLSEPDWQLPGDELARRASRHRRMDVVLSESDLDLLELFGDQAAIPMDQLARFLRVSMDEVERRVFRMVELGLVRRAKPLVCEPSWGWLSVKGARLSRRALYPKVPNLGGLERLRAINEARLIEEASRKEMIWLSRRVLRRSRGRTGPLPDAAVKVGAQWYAVEVFVWGVSEDQLRARLTNHGETYAGSVWFCSRRSYRVAQRLASSIAEREISVRLLPIERLTLTTTAGRSDEVEDDVWEEVAGFFEADDLRLVREGRRNRYSSRAVLNGALWVVRRRLAWAELPLELGYGSGATVRRRLREWEGREGWDRVCEVLWRRLSDGEMLEWPRLTKTVMPHREAGE